MPKKAKTEVTVKRLTSTEAEICLHGRTPLIMNRMPAKAKVVLLTGGRRKTAADKLKIKHDPFAEFKDSMEIRPGLFEHTDIVFPCTAFKMAAATASLYAASVNKTDIWRMLYLPDEWVPIYGVPRMRLDVMRQAGVARTPDVRTRSTIREWATEFKVEYSPPLSAEHLGTLLHNAGKMCGVGDSRQERGRGSFGTFRIADAIPEELMDLGAQREAIENPRPYSDDTSSIELIEAFHAEVARRR